LNPKHKRILIDICHPAEVHHFRYLYEELSREGWQFLFAAKDKDVTRELLQAYHLPFLIFSTSGRGIVRKLLQLPLELLKFALIVRRFRPSFIISNLSLHSSWISAFSRVVHIAFVDTEDRRLMDYLTVPFADIILTAESYYRRLGVNHHRYSGNHELAYLHPARFHPDANIRHELGLGKNEPFVIVRFIAWKAFHDVGIPRMSDCARIDLIKRIEKYKRVLITSEDKLSDELKSYIFPLPAQRIHHALAFADLYIGEGITMASESATLGVPAVLINGLQMGYCLEAKKHGMIFQFDRLTSDALKTIENLLSEENICTKYQGKFEQFFRGKIDVTEMMAWFFRAYPSSITAMERGKRMGVWINRSSPCRD